jgi:hypothetical protein
MRCDHARVTPPPAASRAFLATTIACSADCDLARATTPRQKYRGEIVRG